MTEFSKTLSPADPGEGSGVQSLIDRIRDQGVLSAKTEAERIVRDAETKAARLLADARAETDRMRAKAAAEIETDRASAEEALRLSARDTVLQLKAKVTAAFEVFVKRLVTSATRDEDLIKDLVLVLAGHAAEEFIRDKEIQVLISENLFRGQADEKLRARGKQAVLSLSSDMLREGIELVPAIGVHGGARVRLVEDRLEIDLSDRVISSLLCDRLSPRFRSILEGIE